MTARAYETIEQPATEHTRGLRGEPLRTLDLAHWLALVAIAALVALAPIQAHAQATKKPSNASEDAALPPSPEVQAVIDAHPSQHLVICLAGCGNAQRAKIISALPASSKAATSAEDKGPTTPVSTESGSLISGDTTMLPCVAGCGKK